MVQIQHDSEDIQLVINLSLNPTWFRYNTQFTPYSNTARKGLNPTWFRYNYQVSYDFSYIALV